MTLFFPGARPLSDELLFADRAQLFLTPYGEEGEMHVGDFENLSMAWDIQERILVANYSTIQLESKREVYKFGGTLTAGLRHKTAFTKDILFGSDPEGEDLVQVAQPNGEKTITNGKKNRLYPLGALRVTDVTATDGAAGSPAAIDPTKYFVDASTGNAQLLEDMAKIVFKFKAPALTTPKRSIGSKVNKYYRARIRQLNEQGDDIVFPKTLVRVDGNYDFSGDGSTFGNVSISIALMMDDMSPAGFEYGWSIPVDSVNALIQASY